MPRERRKERSMARRKAKKATEGAVPAVQRVKCPHCSALREHCHTGRRYPNGNRQMVCEVCKRHFIDVVGVGR